MSIYEPKRGVTDQRCNEVTDSGQVCEKSELTSEEILKALEGVLGRPLDGWTLWHEDDVGERKVYGLTFDLEGKCLVFR